MARKYLGWAYVSGTTDEGADGPIGAVQYKYGTENEQTGSYNFTYITGSDSLFFTGSIYVSGTVVSENYDVINHTVSYLSASGDSKFGDDTADQHQFTGSVTISGPSTSALDVKGDTIIRSSGSSHLPKLILWSEDTTQADAAQIDFYRYGDGTLASGENLGEIRFWGSENNTTFGEAAAIIGEVDEAGWSTGVSQAGRILFYTTPDGSDTLVERMRLTHSGSLGIGVTTPAYPLEVSGTINITSSFGTSQQLLRGNGTALLGIADENKDVMVGSGHSGKYLSFYTGNSELDPAMRITDAGYVGIGITSPSALLDISGDGSNIGQARVRQYEGAASDGPNLSLMKARGTQASPTIVSNGDHLGTIDFWGHDGSGFETGAKILAQVDGSPSDGTDMPGKLVFQTTPNASDTSITRMTIRQDGKIGMGSSHAPSASLHVFGDITASFGITGSSFVTDGQVSASTFHGDGSNLTGITAGGTGGLFTAINGSSAYITSSIAIGLAAGVEPSGSLHIKSGSVNASPHWTARTLVLEQGSDGYAGMTIMGTNAGNSRIYLSSPAVGQHAEWISGYDLGYTLFGTSVAGHSLYLRSGNGAIGLHLDGNQNVTCSNGNFLVPDDKIGVGLADGIEPGAIVEVSGSGATPLLRVGGNDANNATIAIDAFAGYDSRIDLRENGDTKWSLRNDEPAQYFRITDEHSASALAGATVDRMTIVPWKADGAAQIQVLSPSSTYNATGFNSGVLQLYSTSSVTSGQECTALQFTHRGEAGGSQKNRYGEMTLLSTGVSHAGSFTWKLRGSSAMSEVMRLDHNGHLTASQGRFTAQPSFSAYANASQTTINSSHWMHISANVENYDVGSGYNTTTCAYTAPEKGTYLLTSTVRMDSVNDGGYVWMWIETSNINYYGDLWSTDEDDNNHYSTPSLTVVTQLDEGDTVKVYVRATSGTATANGLAGNQMVQLQGHMLS